MYLNFSPEIEKRQVFLYKRLMRILAIETSCDDTGIAILEAKGDKTPVFKVLSNVVSSQQIHQNYGGVFPMMAKREHQCNLIPVLEQARKQAKLLKIKSLTKPTAVDFARPLITVQKVLEKENTLFEDIKKFLEKYEKPNIDAIAVTHGPGLEPCLWVGVNFAKALSYFWDIPVIPVNHIEGHILVNFLPKVNENPKSEIRNPKQIPNSKFQIPNSRPFPAISLVVSGGHTQLILMKGIGKYKIIGETRDDAAGECFDKCAKILGLGYPGGPIISKIALEKLRSRTSQFLPRPMINSKDYDFSFSGLKTAVLYKVRDSKLTPEFIQQMCVEVQQAIIDVLIKKTINAVKNYKAKTIILGVGVSANDELRKRFTLELEARSLKLELLVPPKELSTDNGLMIAVAAYFNRTKKKRWQSLKANANLRISK